MIESRASNIDPDWRAHVEALFNYSLTLFAVEPGVGNVTLMGEQGRFYVVGVSFV